MGRVMVGPRTSVRLLQRRTQRHGRGGLLSPFTRRRCIVVDVSASPALWSRWGCCSWDPRRRPTAGATPPPLSSRTLSTPTGSPFSRNPIARNSPFLFSGFLVWFPHSCIVIDVDLYDLDLGLVSAT